MTWLNYRTDPKYADRQVWANNVEPDQTATKESSPVYTFSDNLSSCFGHINDNVSILG